MAEEKVRLPIKVVIPQEHDYYKPSAGVGERKVFDKDTDQTIDSLTSQIHVLDAFFKPSFRKFPDAPAVAKVILKKDAIAKSHRPDSLLNRNTCPIFGAGGFGELFVSVKREGLERLDENIRTLRSKTSIADISTIDRIEAYQASDALNQTDLEEFRKYLYSTKKPKPLKLRLFRHRDPGLNDCLIKAFHQQLDELELEFPEEICYDEGMSIYKIASHNADVLNTFANFVGTQSLSIFPTYQVLKSQTIPLRKAMDEDLPPPSRDVVYPVVGIIDSGIDPDNKVLTEWVVGREEFVPEHMRNYDHGSFVGGLIANPWILNAQDNRFPQVSSKIFDVIALPKSGGISEDELLSILEEILAKYPDIRIWNLSLSNTNNICGDEIFSDLAIALDRLQDEHNVIFTISCGNYISTPLRNWPPQNLGEADRVCSPGDSVRGLTVGSVAHISRPNSCVLEEQPSPFSRRGPGPAFIPKPEITHYGGNCDKNGNYSQMGVLSFDGNGNIAENIGTSFSTPIIASLMANVADGIQKTPSHNLLKALLIHSAVIGSDKIDTRVLKYKGFGIPKDATTLLTCAPWFVTLIIETEILPGQEMEKTPFPIPTCLRNNDGSVVGEFILTLVYDPPLDPNFGAEYCRTNIEASLGTYIIGSDGKRKHKRQIPPEPKDISKLYEKYLIQHGFKWSPVKVYRRKMNRVGGIDWRLCVSLTNRKEIEELKPQKFTLLITMLDPSKAKPVYDEVARLMNREGWITEDLQIEERIRVNAR